MTLYKVHITKQSKEYATQQLAREAALKLLEAGVFHVKTLTRDEKHIVELKGEVSTFKQSNEAAQALIRFLKTNELFYVETEISEDSSR